MVKYDYECQKCNHVFEQDFDNFESVSKQEKKLKCSKCESKKLMRQFPLTNGFQLKGKGWFKDGY